MKAKYKVAPDEHSGVDLQGIYAPTQAHPFHCVDLEDHCQGFPCPWLSKHSMNSRLPLTMSWVPMWLGNKRYQAKVQSSLCQTLCSTLHLSSQQVTNLSSHQAKTADGCLHPPQEGAFSHHHPRLPPTVNNCSGSSVSNTSPDRACSSSSVTMALYLSYKMHICRQRGSCLLLPAFTSFNCFPSQKSLSTTYSNAASSRPSFHAMCSSLCRDLANLLFLFPTVLQPAHLLLSHHLAAQHPEDSRIQQMNMTIMGCPRLREKSQSLPAIQHLPHYPSGALSELVSHVPGTVAPARVVKHAFRGSTAPTPAASACWVLLHPLAC